MCFLYCHVPLPYCCVQYICCNMCLLYCHVPLPYGHVLYICCNMCLLYCHVPLPYCCVPSTLRSAYESCEYVWCKLTCWQCGQLCMVFSQKAQPTLPSFSRKLQTEFVPERHHVEFFCVIGALASASASCTAL